MTRVDVLSALVSIADEPGSTFTIVVVVALNDCMRNAYTVIGVTVVAAAGVDCLTDLAVSVPPDLALAPVVHVPPDDLGLANGHGVATAVVREARINWAAVGTGVSGLAWARVAEAAEAGDAVGVL